MQALMHAALAIQTAGTLAMRIFWKRNLIISSGHKELSGRQRKPLTIGEAVKPMVAETSFPKF